MTDRCKAHHEQGHNSILIQVLKKGSSDLLSLLAGITEQMEEGSSRGLTTGRKPSETTHNGM